MRHTKLALAQIRLNRKIDVLTECKGRCHYCGVEMAFSKESLDKGERLREFTIDHKKPKRYGGTNNIANLVGACRSCNTIKGCLVYNKFIKRFTKAELRMKHKRAITAAKPKT